MSGLDLLNSLLCSSACDSFTEKQKNEARTVFNMAAKALERHCASTEKSSKKNNDPADDESSSSDEDENDFGDKIVLLKKRIKRIIRRFEKAAKAREKLEWAYPKWLPLRRKNINKLKEIATKINTDKFGCDVATVTSSVVSALGGLSIAGAILFPPAAPVLLPAGIAASAAGGATVFGTKVTEITLLKNCMAEAGEVSEQDTKDFKIVGDWLLQSQKVIDLLEELIGFKVARFIYEELQKFAGDALGLRNVFMAGLSTLIPEVVRMMVPVEKLARIGADLTYVPVVIALFFLVVLLRKNSSAIFSFVVLSHRVVFGLLKILDLSADVGLAIMNAVLKSGANAAAEATKVTARVVAHGVFAGFGLALDVTNMVYASIDIHKGSISPYAEKLNYAAGRLNEELEALDAVYKSLFPKQWKELQNDKDNK